MMIEIGGMKIEMTNSQIRAYESAMEKEEDKLKAYHQEKAANYYASQIANVETAIRQQYYGRLYGAALQKKVDQALRVKREEIDREASDMVTDALHSFAKEWVRENV